MKRQSMPADPVARMCPPGLSRRDLLRVLGASAAALTLDVDAPGASDRPLRGIFPIVQTPYTEGDEVDYPVLADEIRFLDRTGVHGVVWPQLASQYFLLSEEERLRGAETIIDAAEGLRPAVVLGVQATDTDTAVRYARHAARLEPDAIIALPPDRGDELDLDRTKRYYASIAAAW